MITSSQLSTHLPSVLLILLILKQGTFTVGFQSTRIPNQRQILFNPSNQPFSSKRTHSLNLPKRTSNNSRIIILPAFTNNENGESNNNHDDGDDVATLRNEIEQMKREAMEKLNNLEKATSTSTLSTGGGRNNSRSSMEKPMEVVSMGINRNEEDEAMLNSLLTRSVNDAKEISSKKVNDDIEEGRSKVAISNVIEGRDQGMLTNNAARDELSLLCDSSWKVSFSIGREPGTWMPKDWGVSGERLVLNLEMTFTNQQLYEREEFLGSMGGANILEVKNNELTLAPTITEGERKIRVINGGWRVAQGAGPLGTDLLRFYIEIEEQISRGGNVDSDVYCPAGRIYCNCGYFPTKRQSSGYKARLKRQLDDMINRAEQLDEEIAAEGPFSLTRFKKSTELFRLKVDMQQTGERLMNANVAEPNDSILKISQDGMVGLTKEGGVCCKVNKGISIEYHILGRFNISPVRPRQEY